MMKNSKEIVQDSELLIGDKVEIVAPSGQTYRTMIEDRHDKGPFLMGVPSLKGLPMPVEEGDDIYLVFYRESGRYIAQMKVLVLENKGFGRYMWLLQKAPAEKNQRRGAFRLPIMFDVHILEYSDDTKKKIVNGVIMEEPYILEYEKATSRDLSITGVSLLTRRMFVVEERYMLNLYLDRTPANLGIKLPAEAAPPIEVAAVVKRCVPWRETKNFNIGLQFIALTKNTSEGISRFVLSEQQRQIKKRRML